MGLLRDYCMHPQHMDLAIEEEGRRVGGSRRSRGSRRVERVERVEMGRGGSRRVEEGRDGSRRRRSRRREEWEKSTFS